MVRLTKEYLLTVCPSTVTYVRTCLLLISSPKTFFIHQTYKHLKILGYLTKRQMKLTYLLQKVLLGEIVCIGALEFIDHEEDDHQEEEEDSYRTR